MREPAPTRRPWPSLAPLAGFAGLTAAYVSTSFGVVVAPQVALIAAAAVSGLALVAVGAWAPLVTLLSVRMFGDVGAIVGHVATFAVGALAVAIVALALVAPLQGRGRSVLVTIYTLLALSVGWAAVGYGDASGFAREWLRLGSVAALAILALSVAQRAGSIERLLRIALATAVIPAFVALAQFGTGHVAEQGRAYGTFSHPNAAGAVFAFALLISLALALRTRRPLDWSFVLLFCAAVFTTRSLGSLAATMIGVLALTHFRLRGVKRGLLFAGIVGALLVFALSPIGAERVSELQSTTSYSAAAQGHITNSLDWRFLNWHLLLGVWREHPLFGTGQSSTREFVQPLGTLPHNEYVRVLVEGGVVGALVVAFGFLCLIRAVWRRPSSTLAGSVGRALVIAVLVDGVADNLFNYTPAIYLVAVGIGLALGASRVEAREEAPA